jgi:hypothetical protein
MGNKDGGIKVVSNTPCPIETISAFNRRIAEIIVMRFPKDVVEKIISEYKNKDQRIN